MLMFFLYLASRWVVAASLVAEETNAGMQSLLQNFHTSRSETFAGVFNFLALEF